VNSANFAITEFGSSPGVSVISSKVGSPSTDP
jgi:hypothetical protein